MERICGANPPKVLEMVTERKQSADCCREGHKPYLRPGDVGDRKRVDIPTQAQRRDFLTLVGRKGEHLEL